MHVGFVTRTSDQLEIFFATVLHMIWLLHVHVGLCVAA